MKKFTMLFVLSAFMMISINAKNTKKYKMKSPKATSEEIEKKELKEIKEKVAELTKLLKTVDFEKIDLEKAATEDNLTDSKYKKNLKLILETLKSICIAMKNSLIFLVDKSDKIVSIKFLITSLIILSPFLYWYTQYHDTEFLERTIAKLEPKLAKIVDILADLVTKFVSIVKLKMQEKELENNIVVWWKYPAASLKVLGSYLGVSALSGLTFNVVGKLLEKLLTIKLGSKLGLPRG